MVENEQQLKKRLITLLESIFEVSLIKINKKKTNNLLKKLDLMPNIHLKITSDFEGLHQVTNQLLTKVYN